MRAKVIVAAVLSAVATVPVGRARAAEPVKVVMGFEIAELPRLLASKAERYEVGKPWPGGEVKAGWRFKDQADLAVADGYAGDVTVYWVRSSSSRDYPVFHCTTRGATQGRHARLFAFDEKGRSGLGGARMACPADDWSGYDYALIDVASSALEVTFEFYAVDQAGGILPTRLYAVPAGKTVTCAYPLAELAKAAGVDLTKLKSFHLTVDGAGGRTDVTVDNVRLVVQSALAAEADKHARAAELARRRLSPEQETLLAELRGYPSRIVFQSRACRRTSGEWTHASADETWEIHLMNADGTDRKNLTNTSDVHEVVPRASPAGKRIAYAGYSVRLVDGRRQTRSAIYVMDADGANKRLIAEDAQHPAWTPDGACVSYTKNVGREPFIFKVKGIYNTNLATGKEEKVCDVLGGINICWLPDGRYVYAWNKYPNQQGAGQGGVWDTEERRLVNLAPSGCRADFAPDGRRVISNWVDTITGWTTYDRQPDGVFRMGLGGTQLIFAANNHSAGIPYFGDWSPDSRYIALAVGFGDWTTLTGGDWDIYVARADLSGAKPDKNTEPVHVQLTFDEQVANREPDWVPVTR